jgi:hypothetical protein
MSTDKIINKIKSDDEFHIQDQKHAINTELIGIIKFRQSKKWLLIMQKTMLNY